MAVASMVSANEAELSRSTHESSARRRRLHLSDSVVLGLLTFLLRCRASDPIVACSGQTSARFAAHSAAGGPTEQRASIKISLPPKTEDSLSSFNRGSKVQSEDLSLVVIGGIGRYMARGSLDEDSAEQAERGGGVEADGGRWGGNCDAGGGKGLDPSLVRMRQLPHLISAVPENLAGNEVLTVSLYAVGLRRRRSA